MIYFLHQQNLWPLLPDLGIGNRDFNFHTRLNRERRDLLDNLSWALEINDAFMDPHLESEKINVRTPGLEID